MDGPRLDLFQEPRRVAGSMAGSQFGATIVNMPAATARELAIYQQLVLGNIPDFLRRGIPIPVSAGAYQGVFWAMPDYLAIGDNDDFLRMPMRPTTAQKAAQSFGAALPTRKMVNAIWWALPIHVGPTPMGASARMSSVSTFGEHNALIQKQLDGRDPSIGVDGHKKTVVIAKGRPKKNVAIYGWHKFDGHPIQGPQIQMSAHTVDYLDYSHGIRWVHNQMLVNGELLYLESVLTDVDMHPLLSDEGLYELEDCGYNTEI